MPAVNEHDRTETFSKMLSLPAGMTLLPPATPGTDRASTRLVDLSPAPTASLPLMPSPSIPGRAGS